mmetsp:Transcript_19620/g.42028  ORF Transcript_19620/g.42028 Transcript_19620/m.42028 type:complete len:196 (+) Transcript_19620:57-644(+)|eukprot:CAMPEP_0172535530 /NCGR_PEP_ID=MMETSP1067-20121228/7489_1 /TAXON_ID=265564 ORGANISM="Thalassiosira punctigera, Strain Tpunct2005C2" /NCGR_SAMPLE_ID=MMETSP1067 /ASSEMBLY_ACC=CAM_ASM_000444 /LENGTH=195 /DNA_ID=CAMNT_0013320467 /DNA_START=59 /DNA_END=646 /DNA_ORIENTATION=-
MKSVAAVLALAASASAFAPAPVGSRSAALNSVFEDYIGAQDFKGGKFEFDPLNLAETYSPLVPFFREAELRHGRTAQLAVLGFIATDFVRIPGDAYSFSSIPNVVDAHNALLDTSMKQLLLWIGLFDLVITIPAVQATMNGERDAGDFGIKYTTNDPAKQEKYAMNELLHGRLAMCAVGGIATQSVITGHGFPYV